MHRFCHDYSGLGKKFNLPTVESFQENIDGILCYKIMSKVIKCKDLRSRFPFNNPDIMLRSKKPFFPNPQEYNTMITQKNPIFRLSNIGNEIIQKNTFLIDFKVSVDNAKILINKQMFQYK